MTPVTTLQLLVRSSPGGERHLDVVDSRADTPVWEYEDLDRGVEAASLGTDGMLRLASILEAQGHRVLEIDLRDSNGRPFDDGLDDELQSTLLSRLRMGGADASLGQALVGEYGLVIMALTVRLRALSEILTVTRDGQVSGRFSSIEATAEAVRDSLGIQS